MTLPMCGHPELNLGMNWNPQTQRLEMGQKPPAVRMVGRCQHNCGCPICGFGFGCMPDPCDLKIGNEQR